MVSTVSGVEVRGPSGERFDEILTPEALAFVADLQRQFGKRREELLAARAVRQEAFNRGELPALLAETQAIRDGDWRVGSTPDDLQDRRVEITGPVDRKMIINALNSGAKIFMADLEDATSPTWENVVSGQVNLKDAIRKTISFQNPDGRAYELNEETATLLVRPRGWHLHEAHVLVDGTPISASLFDFGLYAFHNAQEALNRGTGPYYYLPKLESHQEAQLWDDVISYSEERLGIAHGSVKVTVLIETILAAFELEEILYALRDHIVGLNAGRWDYIFSVIKKFHQRDDVLLPDRVQVTMAVPFMRAYTLSLVKACHKRGAHAIGGMAAFIPNRRDPEVTNNALAKVREDKEREAGDGFDGTWVAHPDLIPVAMEIFDGVLGTRPNQKERQRDDLEIDPASLIQTEIPGGKITEAGVRNNVSVALQYIAAWLGGLGAVAIYNLMEDAATAEISRAQLWQWLHHEAKLDDGRPVTVQLYNEIRAEELAKLDAGNPHYQTAAELLDALVLDEQFAEFLTLPAYERLIAGTAA
jgi:malate synthase